VIRGSIIAQYIFHVKDVSYHGAQLDSLELSDYPTILYLLQYPQTPFLLQYPHSARISNVTLGWYPQQ